MHQCPCNSAMKDHTSRTKKTLQYYVCLPLLVFSTASCFDCFTIRLSLTKIYMNWGKCKIFKCIFFVFYSSSPEMCFMLKDIVHMQCWTKHLGPIRFCLKEKKSADSVFGDIIHVVFLLSLCF